MDIEVKANRYEQEQELTKLINLEEEHGVFDFDFKTENDYFAKKREFIEFSFNCIRVTVLYKEDESYVDFPIRTEEEYHKFLLDDKWQERIKEFKAYPSSHFHDGHKYLGF